MQRVRFMSRHHYRPSGIIGTVDGRYAVQWTRSGRAARGEPSAVNRVTLYATEREQIDALLAGRIFAAGMVAP